jgi:NAD(P)H-dependent FMN reductase
MTRILLITGGTGEGSLHTAALRTAARSAPADITAIGYDGLRTLPAFVPGEQPAPAAVAALRAEIAAADAVLFSTPEYAGSMPGSLKNLLDHLVDGGDLQGKPVAWLSVSAPGQDDGALTDLRKALEYAGAKILRSACIRLPLGPEAVAATGLIADPRLQVALLDMLRSLALARSLAAPPRPSWQAYSSVYPIVPRPEQPPVRRPSGPSF